MASDCAVVCHRPARVGLLVFAKNKEKLSMFYQEVLKLDVAVSDAEHDVLSSEDTQLIVHKIPTTIPNHINISEPPSPRESSALKFLLTVPKISRVRKIVEALGGSIVGNERLKLGFMARDVCDPEEKIFRL